jgi:hypothetical protein
MDGHIAEIRKTIGRFLFPLVRSGAGHEEEHYSTVRHTRRDPGSRKSIPQLTAQPKRGTAGIRRKTNSTDRFHSDGDGEFKDF